ncbi:GNAT family N-acetyltransferase [Nonomuraea zeae]|uniref:GNAT family N-acetyltransferase n=1 Tax=Nonomuraea zeae TaxID=1642303 RepID=A0A5S4HFY5_9ACTN|nr:GNAT family N-acetyltransferase [Nonomuraea zeae]TMR37870.1 GNAT family N-acetyltransferase [Nonomuraea zeae]
MSNRPADRLGQTRPRSDAASFRESRPASSRVPTAIIKHLLDLPQYDEYVLDTIADINAPALRLYERLGFTEFKRTKVRHTKITGIGAYVGMRLVQREPTSRAS